MRKILLDTTANASLEGVRHLRHLLGSVTKSAILDAETRNNVSLCFSEVATNCIEHAESPLKGEIKLRLSYSQDKWIMTISDQGKPPAELPESNKIDPFGESGRGLFIVQSLCDEIEYAPSNSPENFTRLVWKEKTEKKKSRLLIIEDEFSQQTMYQYMLQDEYLIDIAPDANTAIALIRSHTYNAILSDIYLPDMNGLELRKTLLQQELADLVPFVFLTGSESHEIIEKAHDLSIDDFIRKPVAKTSLLRVIDRLIRRSESLKKRLLGQILGDVTSALQPTISEDTRYWRLLSTNRNTGAGGGDILLTHSIDNVLYIIVGDIMGHDVSAKFYAHAYTGYLRGLLCSMNNETSPATLMQKMSEAVISDQLLQQTLLTCCVLRLKESSLSLCSAGHPGALVVTTDGELQRVENDGMLPGLIPDIEYTDTHINLRPGERLAIFTDGLYESLTPPLTSDAAKALITKQLVSTKDSSIKEAAEAIFDCFDHYVMHQPTDDATLLLIEPND